MPTQNAPAAVQGQDTQNMRALLKASARLLSQAGIPGRPLPVVNHSDETGFRPDVLLHVDEAVHPRVLDYVAAWHGLIHGAPSVVAFNSHSAGRDRLHVIETDQPSRTVGDALRGAGVPKFSVHGGRAYVFDRGGAYDLTQVARSLNARSYHALAGSGRVIGAGQGADAASGRATYRAHIDRAEADAAGPPRTAEVRDPAVVKLARLTAGGERFHPDTPAHVLVDYAQEHPEDMWDAASASYLQDAFDHGHAVYWAQHPKTGKLAAWKPWGSQIPYLHPGGLQHADAMTAALVAARDGRGIRTPFTDYVHGPHGSAAYWSPSSHIHAAVSLSPETGDARAIHGNDDRMGYPGVRSAQAAMHRHAWGEDEGPTKLGRLTENWSTQFVPTDHLLDLIDRHVTTPTNPVGNGELFHALLGSVRGDHPVHEWAQRLPGPPTVAMPLQKNPYASPGTIRQRINVGHTVHARIGGGGPDAHLIAMDALDQMGRGKSYLTMEHGRALKLVVHHPVHGPHEVSFVGRPAGDLPTGQGAHALDARVLKKLKLARPGWSTDRVWRHDTPAAALAMFLEDNPEHAHDEHTYDHLRAAMDGASVMWAQHPETGAVAAWPITGHLPARHPTGFVHTSQVPLAAKRHDFHADSPPALRPLPDRFPHEEHGPGGHFGVRDRGEAYEVEPHDSLGWGIGGGEFSVRHLKFADAKADARARAWPKVEPDVKLARPKAKDVRAGLAGWEAALAEKPELGPVFADYLQERDWAHGEGVDQGTNPTLEFLRSGHPVKLGIHPVSGKVLAWGAGRMGIGEALRIQHPIDVEGPHGAYRVRERGSGRWGYHRASHAPETDAYGQYGSRASALRAARLQAFYYPVKHIYRGPAGMGAVLSGALHPTHDAYAYLHPDGREHIRYGTLDGSSAEAHRHAKFLAGLPVEGELSPHMRRIQQERNES